MKRIFNLDESSAGKLIIAGGKGRGLHRMRRNGFSVPNAIIVSPIVLEEFFQKNGLEPYAERLLNARRGQKSLGLWATELRRRIMAATLPVSLKNEIESALGGLQGDQFAVRSSAAFEDGNRNSWAGQFDSYLNVSRADAASVVKKCWSSLFTVRAIRYRPAQYSQLRHLKFAVVLQEMVRSEKAGVAFSMEPRQMDNNKLLIEAAPGLGDRLVSGKELPLTVLVDKRSGVILRKSAKIARYMDLLSLSEVKTLSRTITTLEKTLGMPVDVEWAFSKSKLYLLQVRPITVTHRDVIVGSNGMPRIADFELTFKARGLSYLFTDMLTDGYAHFGPLYICNKGAFEQYLQKEKMEHAGVVGLRWLSKPGGFDAYRDKFERYYNANVPILESLVSSRRFNGHRIKRFFAIISTVFRLYSKMDFPYTNLTYLYSAENATLRDNLKRLSAFKDVARAWINNAAIEETGVMRRMVKRLSETCGIDEGDLQCYSITEIGALLGNFRLSRNEISKRADMFSIFVREKEKISWSGRKAGAFINAVSKANELHANAELTGQVANGTVETIMGRVRVISVDYGNLEKMSAEIDAMDRGEILVSEFTAPELMEACKKAKAIVTDLGGMLSHAAIVSRELGIPCLVGTQNASKILRSGDRVTIDFKDGTVTKCEEISV